MSPSTCLHARTRALIEQLTVEDPRTGKTRRTTRSVGRRCLDCGVVQIREDVRK